MTTEQKVTQWRLGGAMLTPAGYRQIQDERGREVCLVDVSSEEDDAPPVDERTSPNAALIAAAPDLLAALEAVVERGEHPFGRIGPDGEFDWVTTGAERANQLTDITKIARAAIARAKGDA